MTVRKLGAMGLLATALIAAALFAARAEARSAQTVVKLSTSQSEIAPGSFNQGWWASTGLHFISFENYIVGDDGSRFAPFRNFFIFDASLLPGCARNASLQIPRHVGSGDEGLATTGALYTLHDVSTDPVTLKTGSGNVAVFDDLGSGAFYGSTFLPTVAPYASDSFIVPLNATGLAALNAAALSDALFSVGGMIAGEPVNTYLFGFSGGLPVNLIVTVASPSVSC